MGIIARLSAAFRPRTVTRDRVVTVPPLWQQFWRIGGGLTPNDVSHILRLADTGQVWRLVDLGNESRQKDTHLQAVLYTREIGIASLPWKVLDPEDANERELEAGELIRYVLENANGGNDGSVGVVPLVAHLQRGPFFGYSVAETDWQKFDRWLVPAGFWTVPHRLFAFDGLDGKLKWSPLGPGMQASLVDLLEEFPARFIQHQPHVNGDVAAREGLIRVLVWAAIFRNWTLRDWLTLAELAWKPWRIGTYKVGASGSANKEDIDALWRVVESLTSTGAAVKSSAVELDVHWPENQPNGSRSAHGELYSVLGEGMSKAVLGQTLTTEASARGTQALGTVQNQVREDYRRADAMACNATLMRDLWMPLIRMNFGDGVRCPAVMLVPDEGIDRLHFAQAMQALQSAGLRIPARWVRSEVGMPEPIEGEELMIPITVEPPEPEQDDEKEAA